MGESLNNTTNSNLTVTGEDKAVENSVFDETIAFCKIHPAVGIARVGNSPDEYFIGPELPDVFDAPIGGYKDAGDLNKAFPPRVKRQAARFRLYGYDSSGKPIKELTFADADIEWTVHLANRKAEWDQFRGRAGEELPIGQRQQERRFWRNRDIGGGDEASDREARKVLVIDSGPQTLKAPNQIAEFDQGKFFDVSVPLGEMRTDSVGRLLVLGGFGKSGTAEQGRRITNYANNDRWYDDVSDGPVTAKVRLKSGEELKVAPAWAIVAPPDFAPGIPNIVTLYDVVYETAVAGGFASPPPERPSFTNHIFPILWRPLMMTWVQFEAISGHGAQSAQSGNFYRSWEQLISNKPEHKETREKVFSFLRDPNATGEKATAQANKNFMPPLSGDDGDATDEKPGTWLTLTKTQYEIMRKWAEGEFEADWNGAAPSPSVEVTPEGLDRAALEACTGGAFFPGIEGGWILRNPAYYSEAFRLNHDVLAPGDATKRMAVPWQADFYECKDNWWPAQRPDQVLTLQNYERIKELSRQIADPELNKSPADEFIRETLQQEIEKLFNERVLWARLLPLTAPEGDNEMVDKWKRLGFLVNENKDGTSFTLNGLPAFVETETVKYQNMSMAEYFHYLVNIEDYPDFLPTARELALEFFSKADYSNPNLAYFDYNQEAFDERMDKIYNEYTATMDDPHWLDAEKFSTEAIIENLRQKAPMNLVDGAWLQNILNAGPCDDVRARLFSVWADEAGNGKTELNHCNIYDALLRSVNIYTPPITSRQFIEIDLLASAWSNPVFQLSVGLFPQEFFPELLGMTLYLEWEATPTLTPTVRMLRNRGINPHFYRMHVAIDNVASGHGALAKEAVKLYLDEIRESGGEREVQEQWKRIWNGYVTWATEGTFGGDLYEHLLNFDGKKNDEEKKKYAEEKMISLIRRKSPYARKAHGTVMLGKGANSKPLNSLFDDPPLLMQALLEDPDGWVNLEKPRDSRFFIELLSFSGPMYKVFTDADQDIILDWLESQRPSQPVPPVPPVGDIGQKMKEVIETYAPQASAEPRHLDFTLPDDAGNLRTVQDWFRQTPEMIMQALANSEYIVKGSTATSRFFTEVLVRADLMGGVNFSAEEVAVMKSWVDKGCPQPGQTDEEPHLFTLAHAKAVRTAAAEGDEDALEVEPIIPFAQIRQLIGAGSVH